MKDNIFKVDPHSRVGDSAFAEIDTMRTGHGWGDKDVKLKSTTASAKKTTAKKSAAKTTDCASVGKKTKMATSKTSAARSSAAKPASKSAKKPAAKQPDVEEYIVIVEEDIFIG